MKINYIGTVIADNLSELMLPYFQDMVHAGFPSPASDFIESPIDLNEYLIKNNAATFLVRVSGKSMIGAGINDGATLIIDRSIKLNISVYHESCTIINACTYHRFSTYSHKKGSSDIL